MKLSCVFCTCKSSLVHACYRKRISASKSCSVVHHSCPQIRQPLDRQRVDSRFCHFNTAELPAPNVPLMILTDETRPQETLPKGDRLFFQYMRDGVKGSEESSVNDFAAFILCMSNYGESESRPGDTQSKRAILRHMCAVVDAKPDICEMSESIFSLRWIRFVLSSLIVCFFYDPIARY
jgi:hypothetical protein